MPPHGYHGQYLRIDATTGASQTIALEEQSLRRYLGGSGLGTHIMLREGAATIEPLSAAAPLAFVFSPLVGSPLTTSAKFAVVSRSPLTRRINDSLASSGLALAGKKTGYDALVIVGRAAAPSILIIDDDQVRLELAGDLWGQTITDTEGRLRERLGSNFKTAVIGPAGERQVLYATISHDGRHAGRGGSGAVLGAKNIKAVAVRGTRRTDWAEPDRLVALAKSLSDKSFGPATEKYRELGTAANLLVFNRLHALPTRNFQQGSFEAAAVLSPEQLAATRDKARGTCVACTIGCEHIYGLGKTGEEASNSDESTTPAAVRIEYENLFAFGPLCGIEDAGVVLQASHRCDQLGLDTISTGGTIAFAMECVERELINAPWLRFGDGEAVLRAIDLIGACDGIGQQLAQGSRNLAQQIGHGAIEFAPQVKGLEIPGYEPRALQNMALGFAVGTRGADHNRSGAYEVDFSPDADRHDPQPEDVHRAVETEDRAALIDSLILCKFLRGVFDDFWSETAEMLRLVTGWNVTADELLATAQRIVTARKQFNILAGWTPAEDTLPARFLNQPLADDARAELSADRLAELIRAYHAERGWTAEGWLPDDQVADVV